MKSAGYRTVGLVLIASGAALLLYGVHLASSPNFYQSTVRFAVEKPDYNWVTAEQDPSWRLHEFEKIQSKEIMHPVITNLDLHKKWAERRRVQGQLPIDETYAFLRKRTTVRSFPGTTLFEIAVRNEDRLEAPVIANAIAEEYCRIRRATRKEMRLKAIAPLTNHLYRIEQEIQGLEDKLKESKTEHSKTNDVQHLLEKAKAERDSLRVQIVSEMVDSPRDGVVEIIDRAEPCLKPISPNKYVMCGAFLFGTVSTIFGVRYHKKGKLTRPAPHP